MKFSASDRNSCKEAMGFDERLCKKHLWHLKLRFARLMIALSPVLPPPLLLMYSGANVRVHRAHIKANALHGSALAPAIKGFQRRYVCMYVCMWQQRGDLSVSARPCMQMHQIKCNYTRRKFTLGLHPPLCWCASFAQNSTSDKLHGEEKERPEFVLFRRRRQRWKWIWVRVFIVGTAAIDQRLLAIFARQKLRYTQNVFFFLFGRGGSVPEAFGGIL
jgi:hypothetical protein